MCSIVPVEMIESTPLREQRVDPVAGRRPVEVVELGHQRGVVRVREARAGPRGRRPGSGAPAASCRRGSAGRCAGAPRRRGSPSRRRCPGSGRRAAGRRRVRAPRGRAARSACASALEARDSSRLRSCDGASTSASTPRPTSDLDARRRRARASRRRDDGQQHRDAGLGQVVVELLDDAAEDADHRDEHADQAAAAGAQAARRVVDLEAELADGGEHPRARVASATRGEPLMTRETVALETPAAAARSRIVGARPSARGPAPSLRGLSWVDIAAASFLQCTAWERSHKQRARCRAMEGDAGRCRVLASRGIDHIGEGRTALVTGAAAGIGAACAARFLDEGWTVHGWDVADGDDARIALARPSTSPTGTPWRPRPPTLPPLDAAVNCAAIARLTPTDGDVARRLGPHARDQPQRRLLRRAPPLRAAAARRRRARPGRLGQRKNTTRFRAPYNASKAGHRVADAGAGGRVGARGARASACSPSAPASRARSRRRCASSGAIDEDDAARPRADEALDRAGGDRGGDRRGSSATTSPPCTAATCSSTPATTPGAGTSDGALPRARRQRGARHRRRPRDRPRRRPGLRGPGLHGRGQRPRPDARGRRRGRGRRGRRRPGARRPSPTSATGAGPSDWSTAVDRAATAASTCWWPTPASTPSAPSSISPRTTWERIQRTNEWCAVPLRSARRTAHGRARRGLDRRDRLARLQRDLRGADALRRGQGRACRCSPRAWPGSSGERGVRTNVVHPGWIETELNREYLWSEPELRERVVRADPAAPHGTAGGRGAGGRCGSARTRRRTSTAPRSPWTAGWWRDG